MRRLAFITAARWRGLCDDDRLVAAALERRGFEVSGVVWDELEPGDLARFEAVVMRSPWDWYLRPAGFRAFLETLGRDARIFNAPEVLRRFADKTYFKALQARGLGVVPTSWLTVAELYRLPELVAAHAPAQVVVKPAFSANAHRTFRLGVADAPAVMRELAGLPADAELMVQPYFPEIEAGEWSLVFFGGEYSHAARKRPKPGDFRVQVEHGGASTPAEPPASLVAQARALLEVAAPGTLYARVDGVTRDERLYALELELVEPELFFRHHPEAPERFAAALERALDG